MGHQPSRKGLLLIAVGLVIFAALFAVGVVAFVLAIVR